MEAAHEDDECLRRGCSRYVFQNPVDAEHSSLLLDTHGGALVNLIHSYTENGDPFIRQFTDQLLEEVGCLYSNLFGAG